MWLRDYLKKKISLFKAQRRIAKNRKQYSGSVKCCLCGNEIEPNEIYELTGIKGHLPFPVSTTRVDEPEYKTERCCDECHTKLVMPSLKRHAENLDFIAEDNTIIIDGKEYEFPKDDKE